MRILSIDDSKAVHAFVTSCFEGTSHTVVHAFDGFDGLNVLSDKSLDFDLILLDWEMPGMTGPEVLEEIIKRNIKTPVVMVTTKNSPAEIARVIEIGAKEYIMKPFTREILIEKIESLF